MSAKSVSPILNNIKNKTFNLKKSATLATHQLQTNQKSQTNQKTKNIKFGFGQSPFSPPKHIHKAIIESSKKKLNHYAPVAGIPELQQAISDFQFQTSSVYYKPENTLIMPGSKQGMFTLLKAFQPDTLQVYIPAPSWVSYKPQADICNHECIYIPTNFESNWQISPENLDMILTTNNKKNKQKLLILTSPDNPTGLSYSHYKLNEIFQVLEKHNALVISDEIYALLNHNGKHSSMASHYPTGTILSTGISKAMGAGGWRLGALMLPEDLSEQLRDPIIGVSSEIHSSVATPIQEAAITAFQWDDKLKKHITFQRKILKNLGGWCQKKLNSDAIRAHKPDGAFYLFLDFMLIAQDLEKNHNIKTSQQLCDYIRDNLGVTLLTGDQFGLHPEHLCARLAYVDFDGDKAIKSLMRRKDKEDQNNIKSKFLNKYCANVIDGVTRISDWSKQFTPIKDIQTPTFKNHRPNSSINTDYTNNINVFTDFMQLQEIRERMILEGINRSR